MMVSFHAQLARCLHEDMCDLQTGLDLTTDRAVLNELSRASQKIEALIGAAHSIAD